MKTNLRLFVIIIMFGFCCCNENENLEASMADINWYQIKDNPSNKLDHLIYTIYEETGVPIFYNDTIGCEERGFLATGEPLIHWEVLDIDYTIENAYVKANYELSQESSDIYNGVVFLKEQVIPFILNGMYPKCFLLVEQLNLNPNGIASTRREGSCYKALTTTVVGKLSQIKNMTEQELDRFAAEILSEGLAFYLVNEKEDLLTAFYNVSFVDNGGTLMSMYGKNVSTGESWESYGFLSYDLDSDSRWSYNCPQQKQDVFQFVTEVLVNDETTFKEKYKDNQLIKAKYDFMKQVLREIGMKIER